MYLEYVYIVNKTLNMLKTLLLFNIYIYIYILCITGEAFDSLIKALSSQCLSTQPKVFGSNSALRSY